MRCRNCDNESGEYELCKPCYYDLKEGLIDKCKCGRYKDSEYSICYECHKELKSENPRKKIKITDSYLKGRLAEAIVEEMFFAMGYMVYRFGVENTVPGFINRYLPKKGDVAEQVRKMPDFIVVRDSQIALLEVKYRSSGEFDFNDFYSKKGEYPYKNAYFVLVTPNQIKIQKALELENGRGFVYLHDHPDFETDKEIILRYIEYCKKFFGNR